MKRRRILSLLLIVAMLACLCVSVSADGELFFVAVNDTIPLTLTVFPTYSGGTLYVPYQVFDSQPCGVTPSYNQTRQTYVLFNRSRQMLFDLAAGTVSDESGSVSTANVLYRSGILYLPLTFCASHFGLKTTMLESAGGYQVLRFTDGSEVYDDSLFIEKAENLIAYRVQQYAGGGQTQDKPSERPGGNPGTQTDPAAEKKPATVFLAFTGSQTMRDSMAALKKYSLQGSFFLTEDEILTDPALVFELLAAGHTIGLTVPDGEADPAAALARSCVRRRSSPCSRPARKLRRAIAASSAPPPPSPPQRPPRPRPPTCSSAPPTPTPRSTRSIPPTPAPCSCSRPAITPDGNHFFRILKKHLHFPKISDRITPPMGV